MPPSLTPGITSRAAVHNRHIPALMRDGLGLPLTSGSPPSTPPPDIPPTADYLIGRPASPSPAACTSHPAAAAPPRPGPAYPEATPPSPPQWPSPGPATAHVLCSGSHRPSTSTPAPPQTTTKENLTVHSPS